VDDINRLMAERRDKLDELRGRGINPYPSGFQPSATLAELLAMASRETPPGMDAIPPTAPRHTIAGRILAKNLMGKAMFLRLRDRTLGVDPEGVPAFQVYLRKDRLGEAAYDLMKDLDIGDFLGVTGPLFATKTGEPTVLAESAELVAKSLRPLPDKFHGLSDVETRYRQRYVDLVVNPEVKAVFHARAKIMSATRHFLQELGFLEVETPMMQPIPGGANARPFETFHNALSMPLYLRIAPELYLKRLVVGGLERVFEINRNFRNEGLSPRHNPEFTMLEFYQAYATYHDLMLTVESLLESVASGLDRAGGTVRPFGEHRIDYQAPYRKLTMKRSLVELGGLDEPDTLDRDRLARALRAKGHEVPDGEAHGLLVVRAFETLVEPHLVQPTFITEFPVEVSPLARKNDQDPTVTDRFELFAARMEVANAFSELNDPLDQRERFEAQVRARDKGDQEAMYMDLDYLRALEYGMPPTAGCGVGIDRLVMLMTNQHTIREVILFPHLRPE
jgi:lysyl-tRNA synthetase class 2